MTYKIDENKTVNIPDEEIHNNMVALEVSEAEAIKIWLEDNEYEINEEQESLDKSAKAEKIKLGARQDKPKDKPSKPRTVKISDEKKELFESIVENLTRCVPVEQENIKILKENKLIEVKIGEKVFKIDLIETRKKA